MPSQSDAINAFMTLKELAETEQTFLTEILEEGRSVTHDELRSHLALIKTLLGAQSGLLQITLTHMMNVDDKLIEILNNLE